MSKVALVTGGMGGLGTAICKALAQNGVTVVANCLPGFPQKDDWLQKMRADGFVFHAGEADVSSYESCTEMVKQIELDLGPVDILCNIYVIARDSMFRNMAIWLWDALFSTKLDSYFTVSCYVL